MKRKTKTIQLQVKEPCSQNYNEMVPLPGGRFCDQCEKTVIDFREMSDREAARFYQKSQRNICGIFRNDQLNKEISLPFPPSKFQRMKAVGVLVSGLLLAGNANAQTNLGETSKIENVSFIANETVSFPNTVTISGTVKNEHGEPMPWVNVALRTQETNMLIHGTESDEEGYFEVTVDNRKGGYEVTFSFLGYENHTIHYKQANPESDKDLEIDMKPTVNELEEIVVVAYGKRIVCHSTVGLMVGRYPTKITESEIQEEELIPEVAIITDVFPNPFTTNLSVKLDILVADTYLFHLYDSHGQLVFAETIELTTADHDVSLDFIGKRLIDGVYYLRISNQHGEIKTKKVVKMNTF